MHTTTTPVQDASDGTRERVSGPFKGYHVAVLGCFVGGAGAGFRGFYKICRGHPDSYWTAESVAQGRCAGECSSGVGAMRMAEAAAAFQIESMPAKEPDSDWAHRSSSTVSDPTPLRRIP